jgi:hypothetical protein
MILQPIPSVAASCREAAQDTSRWCRVHAQVRERDEESRRQPGATLVNFGRCKMVVRHRLTAAIGNLHDLGDA